MGRPIRVQVGFRAKALHIGVRTEATWDSCTTSTHLVPMMPQGVRVRRMDSTRSRRLKKKARLGNNFRETLPDSDVCPLCLRDLGFGCCHRWLRMMWVGGWEWGHGSLVRSI